MAYCNSSMVKFKNAITFLMISYFGCGLLLNMELPKDLSCY